MTGPGARRAAAQVARPAPSCSASPILLACLWALRGGWGVGAATFWSCLNPCDFSRPVSFSTSPACRAKTFPGDPSLHNLYPNPHPPPSRPLSSRMCLFPARSNMQPRASLALRFCFSVSGRGAASESAGFGHMLRGPQRTLWSPEGGSAALGMVSCGVPS